MIEIVCACGAHLEVLEAYAGGQIQCRACGAPVDIPSWAGVEEKIRFHCPRCDARVVARRTSAGKKSECPSCRQIYVVPDPREEPIPRPTTEEHRIRIDMEELSMRSGLPFPVGKLERPRPAEPEARFLHQPAGPPDRQDPFSSWPEEHRHSPGGDDDSRSMQDAKAGPVGVRLVSPKRGEDAVDSYPRPATAAPRSAPPLASPVSEDPADVGELRFLNGSCSGLRVPLNFRRFLLGTEHDCNLRPESLHLSRHHCVFKKDEYALRVRDLGSRSGTFVNGRRVFGEVVLSPGDEVTAGNLKISIVLPQSPQVTRLLADSRPSISDFIIL